jgi:hypothetical protein
MSINEGKIEEIIEKELEELESPEVSKNKKDVLDEATELVNDDDVISEYSSKISVLHESSKSVKMIDKELQKEE